MTSKKTCLPAWGSCRTGQHRHRPTMPRGLPNYKFMPILFLTTESQQSRRLEAKAAGASGWLVKPATANELLSTIKLVIP